MNREDTKKAAEIMLAFVAGEEIQFRPRWDTVWVDFPFDPSWNWVANEYRVKPKAPPIYYAVDYSLPERRTAAFVGMLYDTQEEAEVSKVCAAVPGRVIALQEVAR